MERPAHSPGFLQTLKNGIIQEGCSAQEIGLHWAKWFTNLLDKGLGAVVYSTAVYTLP